MKYLILLIGLLFFRCNETPLKFNEIPLLREPATAHKLNINSGEQFADSCYCDVEGCDLIVFTYNNGVMDFPFNTNPVLTVTEPTSSQFDFLVVDETNKVAFFTTSCTINTVSQKISFDEISYTFSEVNMLKFYAYSNQ